MIRNMQKNLLERIKLTTTTTIPNKLATSSSYFVIVSFVLNEIK